MKSQLLPTSTNSPSSSSFNINSILKQILNVIINSSIVVKSLSICILIGYLLSFIEKSNKVLCIIPGKLLPPNFWVWTLVTHSFYETNIIQALINMFLVLFYSKMLEIQWGIGECVFFYFLIIIVAAICTTFLYFIGYSITFSEKLIFDTCIHGLGALYGGFSVVIKQLMPDTILLNANLFRLKHHDSPIIILFISLVLCLTNLLHMSNFYLVSFGIIVSYIYLKFYQKHKNNSRGDSSSSFTFASFFPGVLHPFISILSNTVFDVLVRIHLCKKQPKLYNIGSPSQITITLSGQQNSAEVLDAERRRQKALKALKERLNKPEKDDTQWTENIEIVTKSNQQENNSPSTEPLLSNSNDEIPNNTTTTTSLLIQQTTNSTQNL